MHIRQFCFVAAVVSITAFSCKYDNYEDSYPEPVICDTDSLTYNIDIKLIVDVNCVVCHSPSGGFFPFLDSYQKLLSNEFGVTNRISLPSGDSKSMPPTGPMNSCDIEKINMWYADGAPE